MHTIVPGEMGEVALPRLVGQFVDDAKGLVRAEIAVVKAKVFERAEAYKGAAIFFGAAAVLGLGAFIAMLVGLILTLATLVGPGFATLIVIGVTFLIAGVLAYIGVGRLKPAPLAGAAK